MQNENNAEMQQATAEKTTLLGRLESAAESFNGKLVLMDSLGNKSKKVPHHYINNTYPALPDGCG